MQSAGNFVQVTIVGRLAADAEIRFSQQQTPFGKMRVGVNTYNGQTRQKETTWFGVTIIGKRAESLVPMLTKGGLVAVSGELQIREYEKDGEKRISVDIVATEISPLSSKQESGGGKPAPKPASKPAAKAKPEPQNFDDDDLPF